MTLYKYHALLMQTLWKRATKDIHDTKGTVLCRSCSHWRTHSARLSTTRCICG